MKDTYPARILGSPSLRRTLLLSAAALIIFFFTSTMLIAWANVSTTTRNGITALQAYMNGTLESIASNALSRGNHDSISEVLDAIVTRPEIKEITLFDSSGKVFSKASKSTNTNEGSTQNFNLKITRTPQLASNALTGGDELVSGAPVEIGHLVYTIDINALRKPALRVFQLDLIMCILTTLIFGALIAMVFRAHNRPIRMLVKSIKEIETGNNALLESSIDFGTELNRVWEAHIHAVKSNRNQAEEIELQNVELQARAKSRELQVRVANAAIIRLDNANAEKDAFVSHIMQDLRPKIGGLISALDFINDYIDSVRALTHDIQHSTERNLTESANALRSMLQQLDTTHHIARLCASELNGTIESLHTASQNMYEDVVLNVLPIVYLNAFDELVTSLKADAEAKSLRYSSRIVAENDSQDLLLLLDWERVALVIRTLISNAITYTDSGGSLNILCELSVRENIASIRVSVDDTGVGIDDSTQARLRDLFSAESLSGRRSRHGISGLSLDLSQRIARHMGATIRLLRSQQGSGSNFCFEFTARLANANSDVSLSSHSGGNPKLRVLFVNDVSIEQSVFRDTCRRAGHIVHCVANIDEALRLLDTQKWDIVFTAHKFNKGPDGLQLLNKIRQRDMVSMNRRTPVVIIVREPIAQLREVLLAQGGDEVLHHLDKPQAIREVLASLTDHIERDS